MKNEIALTEAKDIVRQMYPGSLEATLKLPNSHLHADAIRLVAEAACKGDKEARAILSCIPEGLHFMGLYPHAMKTFDYNPEIAENVTEEGRKILKKMAESIRIAK